MRNTNKHTINTLACLSDHKMIGNRQKPQIHQIAKYMSFSSPRNLKSYSTQYISEIIGKDTFEHSSVILMYSKPAFLESMSLFKHQRYFKRQKVWTVNNPHLSSLMGTKILFRAKRTSHCSNSLGTFFLLYIYSSLCSREWCICLMETPGCILSQILIQVALQQHNQ